MRRITVMRQKIIYYAINTIFAASIYYGLFQNIAPALNIMLVIGWATGIIGTIGILAFYDPTVKDNIIATEWTPSAPYAVALAFDLIVLGLFVWFGYIWLAVCYLASVVFEYQLRNTVRTVRKDNANA